MRGNHDDRAGDPPRDARHRRSSTSRCALGGFALCHHPRPRPARYVLAGHLHPCVSVGGRGFDHLRLPCFSLRRAGRRAAGVRRLHRHAPDARAAPSDRVFAVADDAVARCRRRATRRPPEAAINSHGHRTRRFEHLIARAEALLARLEAVLPHPLARARLGRVDRVSLPQARRRRRCSSRCATSRRSASPTLARGRRRRRSACVRNTEQFVAGQAPTTCC